MGTDYTGGGFEELRREAAAAARDSERLSRVAQGAERSIATDERERRALAARARQATARGIAEAETIVQRGAAAAQVTGGAQTTAVANQARSMDRLATSSQRALQPIQAMRQWGPYAFARSKASADALYASVSRLRELGPALAGVAQPRGVYDPRGRLSQTAGFQQPATIGLGERFAGARASPSPQAMQQYSAGVARTATAHSILNAQMQRHGALSSEFLEQLGRGNVGLREMGNQLLVTAGKFGGWLAAGAGIFALLGTIGAVGSGALDSATGVNQLRRVINNVDTSEAQQGFRSLAGEMNLPIAEVADAQYQMGKVFNDQQDSLEAARIVLAAVKVGELDVATASRYLTSITQGFNLEASDMTTVFGQINVAQNNFGVNIQDTTAGMAKAAGAAKTLGGSTASVLAFFTAARRGAGVTGDVTGTAVQRMTTFLNQNREELRQFGIDVDKMDLDEILDRAFKVAPKLDRNKQIELSQGLFGTFYGPRVGLPALRQPEIFEKARERFRDAGEEDWQRELETTLQNAAELISRIGTELGIMGSNLADSGFLDLLLLGVVALGQMLRLVNGVLGIFNELPSPLRHALSIMLQLYGVFRLMRRFNIGAGLPGAAGRALTNPANQANSEREFLAVQRSEVQNELTNASRAVTRAEIERSVMQERYGAALRQTEAATRNGVNASRNTMVAAGLQAAQHEALVGYQQRINAARLRETVVARELAAIDDRDLAARQQGRISEPIRTGERAGAGRAGGVEVLRYIDAVEQQSAGTLSRMGQTHREINARVGAGLARLADPIGLMRSAGQGVSAGARRVTGAVRGLNLTAVATRLRGVGQGMNNMREGLNEMFGPADALVLGVTALAYAVADARAKSIEVGKAIKEVQGAATLDDLAEQQQAMADTIANESLMDDIVNLLGEGAGFGPLSDAIDDRVTTTREMQSKFYDELDSQSADIHAFRMYVRFGEQRPEGFAPQADLVEQLATEIGTAQQKGLINAQEAVRQRNRLIDALWKSGNVDDPYALEQSVRAETTGEQARVSADQMKRIGERLAAKAPLYNPLYDAALAVTTARGVLRALRQEGGDPEEVEQAQIELLNAERAQEQAIDERARALLQANAQLRISRIDPERGIARARQAVENARNELTLARNQNRPQEEVIQLRAALNEAQFAQQQAIRQRALEVVDIEGRLREANAPLYAPLASEQSALETARRRLAVLRRSGARGREIRDAVAAVAAAERELQLAANERAQTLLELQGDIALTTIDPENTIGQARQTLVNARQVHSLMISQGRDREEVLRAFLTVRQAEIALQEAIEERAEAIAQARFDIATARAQAAGDEVRAAAVGVRDALYDLSHADTRQERLAAVAALINARAEKRDAIFQTEIEDIEFQADIGKLTIQEQIRAYQRLLDTLNLNRDMRRDLRRRIYALRQEAQEGGEFQLQVGDIRLPTIYEIRRAIGAGGLNNAPQVSVTQTNQFTANGSNADEIVSRMAQQLDTAGGRARNAMRSVGIGG